jgi:hypothetical protein
LFLHLRLHKNMSVKSTLFKVVLGLILTCLALVAAFAFYWDRSWGHYSSFGLNVSRDEQLIAIFHAHQTAFEKLQQMATEDARYGWYFNSPDFEGAKLDEAYRQEYEKDPRYAWYFKSPYFEGGKLKETRRKQYEDLVSEISPGLNIGTDYDNAMRFVFAGGGTSAIGPGWAKGIEYVPGSHETNGAVYGNTVIKGITYQQQWKGVVLTNLDNAQTLPPHTYLRPIEPNWFLFYDRSD